MVSKKDYLKSDKTLNRPTDINLPYFAYGLFKPNQLAYNKIHDLVLKHHSSKIKAEMYIKDGIVLLKINENTKTTINGELFYFKKGDEKEAYDRIRVFEPKKFYKWQKTTVIINNQEVKANVLVGVNIKNSKLLSQNNFEYEDPFFNEALNEIELILNEDEKNQQNNEWINSDNIQHIFRLQMAYLLLWTCIKRFSFLKYPLIDNTNNQYKLIAKEPAFEKTLKNLVKEKRQIYSSNYLNESILNPESPEKSLDYYHDLRFYGVHKETVLEDYKIIKSSLKELLIIFKEIIEYSKHEFE